MIPKTSGYTPLSAFHSNTQSVQPIFSTIQISYDTDEFFLIDDLQRLRYFSCLFVTLVRIMFTKRIILLIIGIFVAIAICLSTSLFGMRIEHVVPANPVGVSLKAHPDFVFVVDRHIDGNAVIAKF